MLRITLRRPFFAVPVRFKYEAVLPVLWIRIGITQGQWSVDPTPGRYTLKDQLSRALEDYPGSRGNELLHGSLRRFVIFFYIFNHQKPWVWIRIRIGFQQSAWIRIRSKSIRVFNNAKNNGKPILYIKCNLLLQYSTVQCTQCTCLP